MAYRTQYNLDLTPTVALDGLPDDWTIADAQPLTAPEIIAAMRAGNEQIEMAIDASGFCADSVTWYDWKADLSAISLRHRGWLFTLDGTGEEPEDRWRAYFLDGQVQEERRPDWEPPASRLHPQAARPYGPDSAAPCPSCGSVWPSIATGAPDAPGCADPCHIINREPCPTCGWLGDPRDISGETNRCPECTNERIDW